MAEKQTVVLKLDKVTKNTFRFGTEDEAAAVRELYVRKEFFNGDGQPAQVKITLEK